MDARQSTTGGSGSAGRPSQSSGALLERAREGDESAREELYARYFPRFRQWAHDRLPDWASKGLDTDAFVHDALRGALTLADSAAGLHSRAFCLSVCDALRNELDEAMREIAIRQSNHQGSVRPFDSSPLEQAVGPELLQSYGSALQRLRDGDRELVVARVELNLDYEEIAELHGLGSPTAARVAVGRALLRLSAEMDRDGEP